MSIGLHNLTIWFDREWTEEVEEFIRSQSLPVNQPGLICGYPNQTMMSYACQKNYPKLVEMLYKNFDADVNAPDSDSLEWNALLWACHLGYFDLVKLLCETCKADVSYRDSTAGGKTAVEVARLAGHESIVEFLETIVRENNQSHDNKNTSPRIRPDVNLQTKSHQREADEQSNSLKDKIQQLEKRVEDIRSMYHQVVKQRDEYEQENIAAHQAIELLQLENESLRALRVKERSREVLFSSSHNSITPKDLEEIRKLHNDLQSENSRLKQEISLLHSKLYNEEKIRQEYEKQLRETQEQVLELRSKEKEQEKAKEVKSKDKEEETQQSRRPFFSPSRKEIARKLQILSVSTPTNQQYVSSYDLTSTRSLSGSDSLEKYDVDVEAIANTSESEDSKESTGEIEELSATDSQERPFSLGILGQTSGEEVPPDPTVSDPHWDWKCDESEEESREISTEGSVESAEESIGETYGHEADAAQEPFGKRLLSLFGKRDEAQPALAVSAQAKPWFWQKHQQLPADEW